tara:strand:+ start:76 stop:237 length:162 start_codon:yes stop_codon:yes gene_type:complete
MKVKDLIKKLQQEEQDLNVVFWNETMDDNHWGCIINKDEVNKTDLVITPTIEE